MGTSASYGGPKGTAGLLPPWADDGGVAPPAPDESVPPNPPEKVVPKRSPTDWSTPKSNLTKWARGTTGYSSSASSLRGFARAAGGARSAATAARSGRATAVRVGGFLAGVARDGFAAAAARVGLRDLVGRDATAVLADLVDRLAPPGAVLEESVARDAAAETLEWLFDQLGVNTAGLAALDAIDANTLDAALREFVTNYVSERFLQALGDCIDRGALSAADANRLYDDVRDVVRETIKLDFTGRSLVDVDWSGGDGKAVIDDAFATAYAFVENL